MRLQWCLGTSVKTENRKTVNEKYFNNHREQKRIKRDKRKEICEHIGEKVQREKFHHLDYKKHVPQRKKK